MKTTTTTATLCWLYVLAALMLSWVCRAQTPTLEPSARPTAKPTPGPSNPSPEPTPEPTFQTSFSCTYAISKSNYGQTKIYTCLPTMFLCPGDTVTVGKCDPTDTNSCFGDQYFILERQNSKGTYDNQNIAAYNDNCQYLSGRTKLQSTCSSLTYTVPTTDSCTHFGVILACAGTGKCGGTVTVTMPGNPTLAPIAVPSYAPTKAVSSRPSGFFSGLFGADFEGATEFIIFLISVSIVVFLAGTFVLCLRFNPSFNQWFWSLEFVTKTFLGHQMPRGNREPQKSNLEMWGYDNATEPLSTSERDSNSTSIYNSNANANANTNTNHNFNPNSNSNSM